MGTWPLDVVGETGACDDDDGGGGACWAWRLRGGAGGGVIGWMFTWPSQSFELRLGEMRDGKLSVFVHWARLRTMVVAMVVAFVVCWCDCGWTTNSLV